MNNLFEIKDYAVCYFDLMGQREGLLRHVRETSNLADVMPEVERVSKSIISFNDAIYGAKLTIEREPDKLLRILNFAEEAIKPLVADIKKLDLGIQQFSDTTIFYVSTDNRIGLGIFTSWCLVLAANYLNMVSNGILIRGGIAIGRGWEIAPNCLYGPVMEDVYRLEGLVADFPRVVLSSKTYQSFKEVDDLDAEELRLQGVSPALMGLKCTDLFDKDFDGVYILDYLSLPAIRGFNRMWAMPKGQICSLIIKGLQYISTTSATLTEEAFKDITKANVARKIALLKSYWAQRTEKICEMLNAEQENSTCNSDNAGSIGGAENESKETSNQR